MGFFNIWQSQELLNEFVDHIKVSINFLEHFLQLDDQKAKKVVLIEELASKFNLKSKVIKQSTYLCIRLVQEALARVTKLEEMGRLSGVMDDRGKYIYISEQVMQSLRNPSLSRCSGDESVCEVCPTTGSYFPHRFDEEHPAYHQTDRIDLLLPYYFLSAIKYLNSV